MPIRREWRKFYRGPEWEATRARILARAKNRCERCGKPNNAVVFTYTWKTRALRFGAKVRYRMNWLRKVAGLRKVWRDEFGNLVPRERWPAPGLPRQIKVQLHIAHVDNNPEHMDDSNLRAWCQFCHLHHDAPFHKQTRCGPKDRRRQVLAA